MISRQHRFHGLGSLNYTYRRGKTVRCRELSLKFIVNSRRKSYRAAVVVSRKVHKSAVVRNRIRRRIYEIVRLHDDNIQTPYDLIFTVFSEQTATMPAPELNKIVAGLLREAKII